MFTSTPEQYGSLYKSQIFKFDSTFIEDHTYVINEVDSGEEIGVKKFYQTNSAEINIAPIIKPYAMPSPEPLTTGFYDSKNFGSVKVSLTKSGSVESGEVQSDEVVFTLSQSDEKGVALLTTLDLNRSLSMGENELILVRCEPYSTVSITVNQYLYRSIDEQASSTADVTAQFSQVDDGRGFVLFSLCAEMLGEAGEVADEELEKITVEISTSSEQSSDSSTYAATIIDSITYYVIDPPRQAMRVAWISSRGSVEHYTMPFITSELAQKDGSRVYALSSALESYNMREAIAEVVTTPTMWRVEDGEYREIEVVDEQIELSPREDLATVQFKISYSD